ncbi:MAG TPA: DUF4412 domain-containing protein [Opitutaceae bacterium]|nr:DUF4412 domain-containing protein [Opitutaceae bacterium]
MKTSRALFLVILSVAARAVAAPFEGKIELLTTEGKKSFTTTFHYKDDKMRIESSESKDTGAMVMDMTAKEMMIMMPSEKMYMVMKFGAQVEAATETTTAPVKTGRTETILGYECHEYTVTEKKTVTEYWAAKGLGVFRSMARGGPGGPPAGLTPWEAEAMREGLFPLRTIERTVKGKVVSHTEVKAIEPGSLSASLFVPPKDFTKFEMPAFGKMFGQ